MERKEKTTAARFNRGRVGAMAPGSSSMTVADFMGIGLPGNGGANFGSAAARSSCCNVLSLLYSLRQHRRLLVTSQVHLRHYDEIGSRHLPREWVRQGRPLGGSRQQRRMGWLWEAHRSACEPTVARHVPQALGPLSSPFERLSSPQAGEVAQSAAPRRGKTRRGRLPEPKRNLEAEPGIEPSRCGAIGIGCKHGLRLHLEKCWQTTKWSASKSAPIRIAGGFSTIQPRPGPSAGATTAPAATARASAVPGPHKSPKPDEEISSVV